MGGVQEKVYRPDPAAHEIYMQLYREYGELHDFFGRGGSDLMKRLKKIKASVR